MSLNRIFVLREDTEYPDGANVVEIVGTGDERVIPRYPNITIALSPLQVISNGIDVVTVTVSLRDYNSSTPFTGKQNVEGDASADANRYEFTVSDYVEVINGVPQIRVWEDSNKQYEITDEIFKVQGSKVRLKDTFVSYQGGPGGLYTQQVWYELDGLNTFSISVGSQQEEWWELNPDGTSKIVDPKDQGQVSGSFYFDAACTLIVPDNIVPIPRVDGQAAEVVVYFRPERNSYGAALINVAYGGGEEQTELPVLSAVASAMTIDLEADPSSIAVNEKSMITAYLSLGGNVVNDMNVNFLVFGGPDFGTITEAMTITQPLLNQEDKVKSSEGYKISVAHGISRLIDIKLDPDVDPQYQWYFDQYAAHKIEANTIELAATNVLPFNELNLIVTYDTGGYASCVFVAPPSIPLVPGEENPEQVSQIIALYAGVNKTIDVTVTPASSAKSDGLSIEAESPVAPGMTTTVTVSHSKGVDYNGRTVSLSYYPVGYGSGPATVVLGTKNIDKEERQAESRTVVSTEFPIDILVTPVVTLYDPATGQDVPYAVDTVTDTTKIHLVAPGLPEPGVGLDVRVTYRALAIKDFAFTAPTLAQMGENAEINCYIGAELITGIVTENVTAKVVVDINAANGLDLSLDPENSSIPYEWEPDPQTDPETPPVVRWYTKVIASSSYYDEETEAVATGNTVKLSMCPTGCGSMPGSIVLGEKQQTEDDIRPSGVNKLSTKYIIKPGTTPTVHITYNNAPYTVAEVKGNEITVNGSFPDPWPACTVVYMAAAIAEFDYNGTGAYKAATAAGSVTKDVENTDAIVYLGGRLTIPDVGVGIGNCEITLNDPQSMFSITIEASESTVYKAKESAPYASKEWRLDDNGDEDEDEDQYPGESELKVEIMMGEAIAPAGTEFTIYCFSKGKEPADDKYDGSVKTGGVVAGSKHVLGNDGTWKDTFYARSHALDTYTFKAVIGQNSSDTSITVENIPDDSYLTYSIPVATIIGWRKAKAIQKDIFGNPLPQGSNQFISDNASIVGVGALANADEWNGVEQSPMGESAADTGDYILIGFHLPQWLDYRDLEEVSISGATVIQPILEWGTEPGQISSGFNNVPGGGNSAVSPGIFGVRWNFEYNKGEFTLAVADYMPEGSNLEGAGVYSCTVTLGTRDGVTGLITPNYVAVTDANGIATFTNVIAKEYQVFIQSNNHKDNMDAAEWIEGSVTGIGVVDNLLQNDKVTVPGMTSRPYILKDTEFSIDVTATVKQRNKYDALAIQSGWTPEKSENVKVNTAAHSGVII